MKNFFKSIRNWLIEIYNWLFTVNKVEGVEEPHTIFKEKVLTNIKAPFFSRIREDLILETQKHFKDNNYQNGVDFYNIEGYTTDFVLDLILINIRDSWGSETANLQSIIYEYVNKRSFYLEKKGLKDESYGKLAYIIYGVLINQNVMLNVNEIEAAIQKHSQEKELKDFSIAVVLELLLISGKGKFERIQLKEYV